jgi:hypothetical protein
MFCGLNTEAIPFREKDVERVITEMVTLCARYRVANLTASDWIISRKSRAEIFRRLAKLDLDIECFYETRADLSKEEIASMCRAGIRRVQPGIESLSTQLLQLMRKGTTRIRHIQFLRWCREYDEADLRKLPGPWKKNMQHLVALCVAMGSERERVVCDSETEIPFLDGQSLLVIMASVSGLPPGPFIVDTGAPTSVLSLEYACKHGISYDAENYRRSRDTAGNTVHLYPAVINEIKVGAAHVFHSPMHVMRFTESLPVAGILSPLDLFRGLQIEFDLRGHILRISPANSINQRKCEVANPIHRQELIWNEGSPSVPAGLFSQSHRYCKLDTGAGANVLCLQAAKSLGLDVTSLIAVNTATAAGNMVIYSGISGPVAIGGAPEIMTSFVMKECHDVPDNDLFRSWRTR